MIVRLPYRISFTLRDEFSDFVLDKDGNPITIEATVMFIDVKYIHSGDGFGKEHFVVLCVDSERQVHEVLLNETKIIEYDKNRSTWDSSKKRRRKRTSNKRNNNSPDQEVHPQEGGSESSGEGNTGETDGSQGRGQSLL